ncbi:hypothetical protein Ddc_09295 [Ditylenchus destructor]|nr:hypothetical protein Ddc_09295 [Ditylenchus destructor]
MNGPTHPHQQQRSMANGERDLLLLVVLQHQHSNFQPHQLVGNETKPGSKGHKPISAEALRSQHLCPKYVYFVVFNPRGYRIFISE